MRGASLKRIAVLLGLLIALAALAGCTPSYYPFGGEECWVFVEGSGSYSQSIYSPQPLFADYEFWEWDGVSEYATYRWGECYETTIAVNEINGPNGGGYYCEWATETYQRVCELPVVSGCDVGDGSMNAHHCARPVALYQGYEVWGIDPNSGEGEFAFEISDEMIEAAGIPTDAPALITEGVNPFTDAPIMIFRLPTGEFQLNTFYVGGKPYIVTWMAGQTLVNELEY